MGESGLFPDDPALAYEIVKAINELEYLNTVGVAQDLFESWGGIRGNVQYRYQFETTPKSAMFNVMDSVVILISGADNPSQFNNLYQSTTEAEVQKSIFGSSPAVYTAGEYLVKKWTLDTGHVSDRFLVAGFSFGGAIAAYLTARLNSLYGDFTAVCCSIAAPRPGLQSLADACGNDGIRWMNQLDPVPYFPPHGSETDSKTKLAWNLLGTNLWNQYVHPFQGRILTSSGQVLDGPLPLGQDPTAAGRLLSWLTGIASLQPSPHAIATYQLLLLRATTQMPTSTPAPPGPAIPANKSVGVQPGSGTIMGSTWVPPPLQSQSQSIVNVPGTSPVLDVPGITPLANPGGKNQMAAYIPSLYRWKISRIAQTSYVVTWMNFTLTKPGIKSNARAVAKWGNKMLRTLGTSPGELQSGFAQAWAAFFAVCTQAGLGFNPPWNVS